MCSIKFFLSHFSEYEDNKVDLLKNYILAFSITILISSCGYVIEGSNPVLPNDAKSLAVLPVQNNTFQGGLETDLSEKLKSLVQNNSSVKLLPAGQADLKLNVTLSSLELPSSGLSKDQISKGMQAILKGKAFLEDRSDGTIVWEEKTIEVKITESEGNQVENAASLMLSGNIRELIKRFAQNLYDRIFTNF